MYMQFYGIFHASVLAVWSMAACVYQTHPDVDQTAYMDAWKKYHKTASTSLPEEEHLDVRTVSKTL